jgi:hypothetical protein
VRTTHPLDVLHEFGRITRLVVLLRRVGRGVLGLRLLQRIAFGKLGLVLADQFTNVSQYRNDVLEIFLEIFILVFTEGSDLHVAET